jgi:hypothetical protein
VEVAIQPVDSTALSAVDLVIQPVEKEVALAVVLEIPLMEGGVLLVVAPTEMLRAKPTGLLVRYLKTFKVTVLE